MICQITRICANLLLCVPSHPNPCLTTFLDQHRVTSDGHAYFSITSSRTVRAQKLEIELIRYLLYTKPGTKTRRLWGKGERRQGFIYSFGFQRVFLHKSSLGAPMHFPNSYFRTPIVSSLCLSSFCFRILAVSAFTLSVVPSPLLLT